MVESRIHVVVRIENPLAATPVQSEPPILKRIQMVKHRKAGDDIKTVVAEGESVHIRANAEVEGIPLAARIRGDKSMPTRIENSPFAQRVTSPLPVPISSRRLRRLLTDRGQIPLQPSSNRGDRRPSISS